MLPWIAALPQSAHARLHPSQGRVSQACCCVCADIDCYEGDLPSGASEQLQRWDAEGEALLDLADKLRRLKALKAQLSSVQATGAAIVLHKPLHLHGCGVFPEEYMRSWKEFSVHNWFLHV